MKIGIVGSTAGSAFIEMYQILKDVPETNFRFYIVTDRDCGLEQFCKDSHIAYQRIEEKNNNEFSKKAKIYFDEVGGVDLILLFFSRLISSDLFNHYPTFNIHPALLPAYKGLNSVKQLMAGKAKFLGCTLHLVDESIDGGPIIGQVIMPISPTHTESMLNKYSFIQKVYLGLLAVDIIENKSIHFSSSYANFEYVKELAYTDRCNPIVENNRYIEGVKNLQDKESVEVIL